MNCERGLGSITTRADVVYKETFLLLFPYDLRWFFTDEAPKFVFHMCAMALKCESLKLWKSSVRKASSLCRGARTTGTEPEKNGRAEMT